MEVKINSVKVLHETKFLTMYEIDYNNKIGKSKKWTAVSRVKKEQYTKRLLNNYSYLDAVLIYAYHIKEEKLVLVKQYRLPLNRYIYEIPAGLIDLNEDVEFCVKRELLEETGLNLLEIKSIINNVYLSPGITDECCSFVFCTCDGDISYEYLQEDESLSIHLVDEKDIDNIIKSDEIVDLKTLFAMQMFKNMGKNIKI